MNWTLKCMALQGIPQLPYSMEIDRWLQRRVTGRYFEDVSDELLSVHNYHIENCLSLGNSEGPRLWSSGLAEASLRLCC